MAWRQALKWCQLAAEQGDVEAQADLAHLYQQGEGIGQDVAMALKWYRLAAAQGHADAQARVDELQQGITEPSAAALE